MNIAKLSDFVEQLAGPLAAAGGSHETIAKVRAIAAALKPFSAHELEAFTAFLNNAHQSLESGQSTIDPPGIAGLRDALGEFQKAMKHTEYKEAISTAQHHIGSALQKLGSSFGLKITAPKIDDKWLEAERSRAVVEKLTASFNSLAHKIQTVEALEQEDVQQALEELGSNPDAILKQIAMANGVDKPKGKGKELVLSALVVKTGLPLLGTKKAAKVKATVADSVVAEMTADLKALAVKAIDPHAVTDEEIEIAMQKVDSAGFSDAQLKQMAFDITGVKEKTKRHAFLAIRGKLTAAKRGLEALKA